MRGTPSQGRSSVVSSTSTEKIAADARLTADARRRIRRELVDDRGTGLILGVGFLALAGAWLALVPPESFPAAAFTACVAAYVVAGSVEFEVGPGCALPTMPVQVVMLFLLPPVLVPPAVLLGLVGAARLARLGDPHRRERFLVLAISGWQVVGPAAVFAIAHVQGPWLSYWPIYLLALLAQFTIDGATSWCRSCFGLGVPVARLAIALRFTFACDLALAPVGFAAARAFPGSIGGLLILLPPILLLAMLQSDRRSRLDDTVALGLAYHDTKDLARRDPLTGLANRLAFEEALARSRDGPDPVGVILADVDGLKLANDTYGHATGDRLLVAVAGVIEQAAAGVSGAEVFRIGGDEFVVLLPGRDPGLGEALDARMRAALAAAPALDGSIAVSASVGVGSASTGAELGSALAAADAGANSEKRARGVERRR